jgi:hypothetical protein
MERRWSADIPVRMSATREQRAERRPDAADERAAHAGGQGCPRSITAPGTDSIP